MFEWYVIIFIVLLILAVVPWILIFRGIRFKPEVDLQKKQEELNEVLREVGFAYEISGDYFYSLMDCWQREMGYCRLYDEAASLFYMIMDCEPITFSYGGKRWLIELWKGQYGITTGAEIGVYYTDREDIDVDRFRGTFYESVSDSELLKISFVLRKNGKLILKRKALHWWLTGFKLGEFSEPDELVMDVAITFPDYEMRDAFVEGLKTLGYSKKEFSVHRKTVSIHYANPHAVQPESQSQERTLLVQKINHGNCYLYQAATRKYTNTLDKLGYIKAMLPEVYEIFLKSLYAKGVFEAFGWIKDWLEDAEPSDQIEMGEGEDDCDWEYPGCHETR